MVKAGKDALDKYGAGLSSVRFICGTQEIHKVLILLLQYNFILYVTYHKSSVNFQQLSLSEMITRNNKKNRGRDWQNQQLVGTFNSDAHFFQELEEKISKFHGREDTILYASCFDANAGLFEILLTPEDAVLSDELNHASIIDGIRLCKAKKFRYKHRDMKGKIKNELCYW